MSIEVTIAPAVASCTWHEIMRYFVESLSAEERAFTGTDPKLRSIATREDLDGSRPIPPGSYSVVHESPSTLVLALGRNAEIGLDEVELVADFGRNLGAEEQARIAAVWQGVGDFYEVQTFGGRPRQEPTLFVKLAAAVAAACRGWVIVQHDLYNVGVGIYPAESFCGVTARFAGR